MQPDLLHARENLRNKLFHNAEIVIEEILNSKLDNLLEIGIFGSLAKDKFTCESDTDIYLLFDNNIPDRQSKGLLRSIAEENNCDIVFLTKNSLTSIDAGLLVSNILENRITLWRKEYDTK
nr:nucleotidyltransferase domain-containing protein [Sedimentibacter sp.]